MPKCHNKACRFYHIGKCELKQISIDATGRCAEFKKGILHYVYLVWDAMGKSNFIDYAMVRRDPDLQIGLYYVMEMFGLGFTYSEHGFYQWITLRASEKGPALTVAEIQAMDINQDRLIELVDDLSAGKLPNQNTKRKNTPKDHQPFGWLSPRGEFIQGDFGEHEEIAISILKKIHCDDLFYEKRAAMCGGTARDFLTEEKGYCLIHNPSGGGGYIVSHTKPLTKAQKEFLYGYFVDIGEHMKANLYANED